jgi:hypothetical protein
LPQYFKYIRRGAVRIEATSTKGDFDPVAFINTNSGYVVVVDAATGGQFTIIGLPAGRYGIQYTTDQEYKVDLPTMLLVASQELRSAIPASGVITIFAQDPAPTFERSRELHWR